MVTPGTAGRHDLDDVRVDTFRASGAGGQHRNKTDSGVRMTHRATGIVVTATESRSQHENRRMARQRLTDALDRRREATMSATANAVRRTGFDQDQVWTWTQWRDQVRSPDGSRASMAKVLKGRFDLLGIARP